MFVGTNKPLGLRIKFVGLILAVIFQAHHSYFMFQRGFACLAPYSRNKSAKCHNNFTAAFAQECIIKQWEIIIIALIYAVNKVSLDKTTFVTYFAVALSM